MSLTVLHLAANRWWTGSADPVIHLATGLRARGHRVLLGVIPGDRFETKARAAGVDVVPGLTLQARLQPLALLRDVRRLSAVIRNEVKGLTKTGGSSSEPVCSKLRLRGNSLRSG